MQSLLFEIPFLGFPIHSFGLMLAIAGFTATWMAAQRAQRHGGSADDVYDLAGWFFLSGLIGARLFYVIQYRHHFSSIWGVFELWRGGLVVFGAAIGAFVGFTIFCLRRRLRLLWMLDVLAPSLALGMAFGRIGCFLNGCCYGDYCETPWAVTFPASSAVEKRLVENGLMSPFGFVLAPESDNRILLVEPNTPAAAAGIRVGDQVVAVNGEPTDESKSETWEPLTLRLRRDGDPATYEVVLPPRRTLPVHPTQLYSSIGAFFLFLYLHFLYSYRTWDGQVISVFAMLYSIGRFLIEFLRYDELPLSDGLTISQNFAMGLFVVGVCAWWWLPRTRQLPYWVPRSHDESTRTR